MAYEVYTFSLKSEEERGATQPNIARIALDSDADALQFGENLESLFSAKLLSINKRVSENYSLPYPAGTGVQGRCALWTSAQEYQMRLRELVVAHDAVPNVDLLALSANLVTHGICLPIGTLPAADSVNIYLLKATTPTGG